jgi:phenylacetate-coenzyme A ligase PaaK-like adenylate-forming protein
LIRQGRADEVWEKYCGFLDLNLGMFMRIQERLLMEQMDLLATSDLGREFMGENMPTSVEGFRRTMPLTDYEDYEHYLRQKQENVLPEVSYLWARTSGRSGKFKWVPYTEPAYAKMGERMLAAVFLAAASKKGEISLVQGDVLLYNTPPRPYSSGIALRSMAELFRFRFVPPVDETEDLSFQERIEKSFETALVTGIDVIGSMTSVLVKIGERFAEGAGGTRLSGQLLHPGALFRLASAFIRSKLAGRPLLPRDLWHVRAALCGGTDTFLYKEKITEYWGVVPHENYSSTETLGAVAVQAWNKEGLFFFPDAVFLEFIPEGEWTRHRENPSYQPATVLLDEVEVGQRYELVISSFDGGPFLRYRMHDLVRFLSLRDEQAGIDLPSIVFAGRSDGLVDLAGFTGLMDEPMLLRAIHDTGLNYADWTARKETGSEGSYLHVYIECRDHATAADVRRAIHRNLKALNQFYADLESMLEVQPLQVRLLEEGTFQAYALEKQAAGADLAHLKPPRMNPSDGVISDMLRISRNLSKGREAK